MSGSSFCRKLQGLTHGDTITVKESVDSFTLGGSKQTLLLLAGGIGITPIRSILKHLASQQDQPGKTILIYGNINEMNLKNCPCPDIV